MKRWLQKHFRRRKTASRPNSPSRRRLLSIERCEDRQLLSGTQLEWNTSQPVPINFLSDGFIVLNAGGWLSADGSDFVIAGSNNFVVARGAEGQSFEQLARPSIQVVAQDFRVFDYDFSNLALDSIDPQIAEYVPQVATPTASRVDAGGSVAGLQNTLPLVSTSQVTESGPTDIGPIASKAASSASSGSSLPLVQEILTSQVYGPVFDESTYYIDPPELSEPPSLSTPAESFAPAVVEEVYEDPPREEPAVTSPGLAGKTPQLQIIDEPVQLAGNLPEIDEREPREGGSLPVLSVVTAAQRAYEEQLTAVVANNLDRDGDLPSATPQPIRPIVAELAREVVFQMAVPQGETHDGEQPPTADELHRKPSQTSSVEASRSVLNDSRADIDFNELSRRKDVIDVAFEDVEEAETNKQVENAAAAKAKRIDGDRKQARATVFAHWPVAASVVASYLLIDRRSSSAVAAVQTPPRRPRRTP